MITNKLIHKEQPMKPIILKEYYDNKDKDIDEQMRQIVLDARNPAWAYEWCLRVKNDDEMRQIFLDHLE